MSLPVGISTVTVTCGPYIDARGIPYRGTLTFTPSAPLVWSATGALVLPGGASVTLDTTGAATVTLPATDATGLNVTGWTYVPSYALTDAAGKKAPAPSPHRIQLPKASPTVALENLQPHPATGSGTVVSVPTVQSIAGLTGVIALATLQVLLGGAGGSGVGPIDGGGPGSVYGPAVVSTADGGDPGSVYGGIPGFDGGTPSSTYAGTTTLNGGTP